MIDASATYKFIKEYASLEERVFCDLHECAAPTGCGSPQHHMMLNFDAVKNFYCKEKGVSPYKSADGLSYNESGILFIIEIKGWELYKKYGRPETKQAVKDKVSKYRLSTKLSDTLMICKDVLSEMDTEIVLPVVYLVVSDVKENAVEDLEATLLVLSETSSDFSHIYGEEIESQLSEISDVDCGFVADCREIDREIGSWKKARYVKLL